MNRFGKIVMVKMSTICFGAFLLSSALSFSPKQAPTTKFIRLGGQPAKYSKKPPITWQSCLNASNNRGDKDVQVGSKEYYAGFLSRNINEESEGRVTGDKILIPTFKFVGGFAMLLGILFVGFLMSNGLL
jgi:hypothetical protein